VLGPTIRSVPETHSDDFPGNGRFGIREVCFPAAVKFCLEFVCQLEIVIFQRIEFVHLLFLLIRLVAVHLANWHPPMAFSHT
jgi:hypothetical protein